MSNQQTAAVILNQQPSQFEKLVAKKQPQENLAQGTTFKSNFYFQEYKSLRFWNNIMLTIWFLGIAGAITATMFIVYGTNQLWYLIFPSILFLLASAGFINVMNSNMSIKRDFTNTVLPSNSKVILPSLVKIYRRLSTNSVNVNWITVGIVFYGLLATLACLFSSWIINLLNDQEVNFGSLIIFNNDRILEYVVYGIGGLLIITLIVFVVSNTLRGIRISKIDSFYGFQIVHINEVNQIKKDYNKRNKWIFLSILILLFFVFWATFRITKKVIFNSRKSR